LRNGRENGEVWKEKLHKMDDHRAPDLVEAARRLEEGHTAIKAALMAIGRPRSSEVLWEMAGQLSVVAGHFRDGRLLAGLKVELVSAKSGARAMGRARSEKKLLALAKARGVLALKRQMAAIGRRKGSRG
jgi:hypothetical protein